jgi:hypothetical protein
MPLEEIFAYGGTDEAGTAAQHDKAVALSSASADDSSVSIPPFSAL